MIHNEEENDEESDEESDEEIQGANVEEEELDEEETNDEDEGNELYRDIFNTATYAFLLPKQQAFILILMVRGIKIVNDQFEAEVLTRSSNESKTSHAVAANLSELELKKVLIDKMERNKEEEEPRHTTKDLEEPAHLKFEIGVTEDQPDKETSQLPNWESARDVYSKRRNIAVTKLQIVEWHNYKHLDWITVRRDDDKLRVEDLQLGVESYQKKLNLTKPDTYGLDLKRREAYIAYSNPRGFIYQNKDKKNRLMCIDKLHKFSDGTLNDDRTALDDRLKRIWMKYLP
ncbi:hypothetical protein Tco_0464454 [Tanacetum coccineum]